MDWGKGAAVRAFGPRLERNHILCAYAEEGGGWQLWTSLRQGYRMNSCGSWLHMARQGQYNGAGVGCWGDAWRLRGWTRH